MQRRNVIVQAVQVAPQVFTMHDVPLAIVRSLAQTLMLPFEFVVFGEQRLVFGRKFLVRHRSLA